MSENNNLLIQVKNLRKVYQVPGGDVVALDGINLNIERGQIYGIIGMSGAGKSTLIRCMNRLDTPTEGQILIDGQNILTMNEKQLMATRRKVSMIFQQFNLLMQKTVARNVRYPLEIAGMDKKKANERVMELLKIVQLEDKANAYPIQLSGGQRQRVAIARALASNPEVLLCDEATSALDPMTTQSILKLLQQINHDLGITVVLITHEMAVIRQICNRVAILDGGKIAEEGTVDDVFVHTRSAAGRRLFFYSRYDLQTAANRMEIDFLIRRGDRICPVEVKSGRNYARHASLDKFRAKFGDRLGESFILCTKDVDQKDGITRLPLYMASCL